MSQLNITQVLGNFFSKRYLKGIDSKSPKRDIYQPLVNPQVNPLLHPSLNGAPHTHRQHGGFEVCHLHQDRFDLGGNPMEMAGTENMAGWWSTPLKNMKVTGIIVPNIWKKNEKQTFQTTNQMENV